MYVTENVHVKAGITTEAIRWAFTTGYAGNWHPVTLISHMLDVELFGLRPRWHHLTNLFFHLANTLLLFFVFHRMTKAPWKSAFVAALFALHPLHVESVAWVAERKDVLSTFFWMLTMVAYVHYVERPGFRSYLAVFAFFALGLMAKPMLVTLPFVLLLLDYWPLQRLQQAGSGGRGAGTENKNTNLEAETLFANKRKGKSSGKRQVLSIVQEAKPADRRYQWVPVRPLLIEKMPFFALAALSSVATFIAQQKGGAVASLEVIPLGERMANAFVSYVIYIGKTIRPDDLAVFYPHPGLLPLWQVLGAVLFLIAVTVTVILEAKKFPYLATGWLWFAGTLVPVIGIVQVGRQAMADRYTYVPLIGLFIMAAWGVPELLKNWSYRKKALAASSALVFAYLFVSTWTQAGYWRNSMTLYDHALEVTSNNDIVHINRGVAYAKLGNRSQAISDYDKAIEINPGNAEAYYNRGIEYDELGNHLKAIEDYDRALDINPSYAEAYYNRGVTHGKLGDHRQAIEDFDRAIAAGTERPDPYYNRGFAYGELGDFRKAVENYDRAIEIDSENAEAYNSRGVAYGKLGDHRRSISDYERAIEINPRYAMAFNNRGFAYGSLGNYKQAIEDYNRAIEINPGFVKAYYNRGVAYSELGNHGQAVEDMKTAARLNNEDARNILRRHGINW
jgi:tetratricopeptide (TPR) repeat protein